MILIKIWNRIMELGGDFDTLEFKVGKHKTSHSYVIILVKGKNKKHLEDILDEIIPLGAVPFEVTEVVVAPAPSNFVFPDNFYSTTNNPTQIYYNNQWISVDGTMMDKVIVVDPKNKRARCTPIKEVKKGVLKSGIIYECVKNGVPFVLAGSIREDGPLPDVITDTVVAQQKYKEQLKDVTMVLMLASTLHAIGVGNMLPSTVKLVCLDINPTSVTKLLARGSTQAAGLVSDIGTFLPLLSQEVKKVQKE
jgi:hypothetical protein